MRIEIIVVNLVMPQKYNQYVYLLWYVKAKRRICKRDNI